MAENDKPKVHALKLDEATGKMVLDIDSNLKYYSKKETPPDISLEPSISTKLLDEKRIPDVSTSGEKKEYAENKPRRVTIRARIIS
jgi:hypothetical protein